MSLIKHFSNEDDPQPPSMTHKPWGGYIDYYRADDCVFKKIVIKPQQSISYQVHSERAEVWFISQGLASIKTSPFGDETALANYMMSEMIEGEYILIQKNTAHQISNNGDDALIIMEMQFGNCSEDDILRLQDPYNRQ